MAKKTKKDKKLVNGRTRTLVCGGGVESPNGMNRSTLRSGKVVDGMI